MYGSSFLALLGAPYIYYISRLRVKVDCPTRVVTEDMGVHLGAVAGSGTMDRIMT
jgi:hypothetical protein